MPSLHKISKIVCATMLLIAISAATVEIGRVQTAADRSPTPSLAQVMSDLQKKDSPFKEGYDALLLLLPDSVAQCLPQTLPAELVRANAAAKAGRFGPAAKPAVPQLIRLLKDDFADSNAALSLGMIGPQAREAVPALIVAIKEHRHGTATALGQLGSHDCAARQALESAARSGPEWLRREAQSALERLRET